MEHNSVQHTLISIKKILEVSDDEVMDAYRTYYNGGFDATAEYYQGYSNGLREAIKLIEKEITNGDERT